MDKISAYIKQLNQELSPNLFHFYSFYKDPINSLGGDDAHALNDFQDYGLIKFFIGNGEFLKLLDLCLDDTDFLNLIKNNRVILNKLGMIVSYSNDLFNLRISINDLPGFYDVVNGEDDSNLREKYGDYDYARIVEFFKKHPWIFELNTDFTNCDPILLRKLNNFINNQLALKDKADFETEIDKNVAFNRIITDDYSKPESCYLFNKNGSDIESFRLLVCNKDFLDVLEKHLIGKVLSEEIFNNIICILRLSIDIVSYYDIYALDVPWYQEMIDNNIGKDRVSEFDIYKCLCIIGRLQKNSKKSKIIYLN